MAKARKEKFDMDALQSSVAKKAFAPLYFFYGDEDFLIEECVDMVAKHAVDPSMKEFNLDILQGNEIDGKKLVSLVSSYPMMSDRRVVVVNDFDKVSSKEAMESYIEKPSPTTVLILSASNPDFRKKPYTTLKKNAVCGEFRLLYDSETLLWIESRMKNLKRSIEPQAIALLHSYVGNSLRELSNEIEKLMIAVGDRATITAKDVETIVGVSKEFTAFELANKVGEKNISKSMEIMERLIGSGVSAIPIVAALTSHFIKLWKIDDAVRQRKSEQELAQLAGVHPFFLRSYLAQGKNYSSPDIENAFVVLAEADLALKSSADPRLVLTQAVTEIIHSVYHTVADS
jgi:DNA polymerase III subunit delta